ncbi:MAG: DUF1178 family protein [Acetobacteraceae bacterium]|nr:DUF1178 family protein [Acetobacteraceae bacterium]
MIHYQLRCDHEHEFDGWFKDSAAFDWQAKRGLVECRHCGGTKISRALMTPAVSKKSSQMPPPVPPQPARLPADVRAALQRLRAEVEQNCDYVGPEFAEEARKIHRGESDKRGIYGETTQDEAEALTGEGIIVSSIPWVPRADG